MPVAYPISTSRRAFLLGAGASTLSLCLAHSSAATPAAEPAQTISLRPAAGVVALGSPGGRTTGVWAYNNRIPGPLLRVRQGAPVRITVDNGLAEATTVHWHGIRLPNPMDGVPGLTQTPIAPGESFVYEFTPPDAGTFWYHPHTDGLQQLGRGLSGVLIVEEPDPPAVDRELVWMIQDWRLGEEQQIAGGFGSAMDAVMSGRIGNLATINGAVPKDEAVRAGERLRLRIINGALARIVSLRLDGHRPQIIAVDGQPCEPHEPVDGRLLLGPAMRIDVILDMTGDPGRTYDVIDDYYDGLSYRLTGLSYSAEAAIRSSALDAPVAVRANPVPEPVLRDAKRLDLVLQGGMMGGGKLAGLGGLNGMATPGMDGSAAWAINGMSMTGDGAAGMPPLCTIDRGRSVVLTVRNETAWWHPMHIHGYSMRVLSRNGNPVPHRQWNDTVLLAPRDIVECAFVADNAGDWMFHCHVADHQMAGLMTVLRVT